MTIDHAWYDQTLLTEAKAIENLTQKLDYAALDAVASGCQGEGGGTRGFSSPAAARPARRPSASPHPLLHRDSRHIPVAGDAPHGAMA
jgi:hypothetical protein